MAQGNFTITCNAQDLNRLMAKLDLLEDIDAKQAVKSAMIQGAEVLKTKAKSAITSHGFVDTGKFKQSPSRHFRKKRKNHSEADVGFRRSGYHGNVAHLLDLGTEERYTKKGQYRGRVKYSGYWTDIKNNDAPKVMENIINEIDNTINKLLR